MTAARMAALAAYIAAQNAALVRAGVVKEGR